jgi:hypothetical protein
VPAIKSQKSELYYASAATTATKIVCPTNISVGGAAADQVDTTCLSDDTRQFVQGLKNAAQVTVQFNAHSGEVTHEDLTDLFASGAVVSWGIYGSETTTAPTAVASEMQVVATRVSMIFDAYVADFSMEIAGNDIWKGTVVLQVSGAISYDWLTP